MTEGHPIVTKLEEERGKFEAFITGMPYERSVARFPDDPDEYAWPGCYRDIVVDTAWDAWQAAKGIGAWEQCLVCHGFGEVSDPLFHDDDPFGDIVRCNACGGTGRKNHESGV